MFMIIVQPFIETRRGYGYGHGHVRERQASLDQLQNPEGT